MFRLRSTDVLIMGFGDALRTHWALTRRDFLASEQARSKSAIRRVDPELLGQPRLRRRLMPANKPDG